MRAALESSGLDHGPITQGKNERFHQTLFRWLDKQPLAATGHRSPGAGRPVRPRLQHRTPASRLARPADPAGRRGCDRGRRTAPSPAGHPEVDHFRLRHRCSRRAAGGSAPASGEGQRRDRDQGRLLSDRPRTRRAHHLHRHTRRGREDLRQHRRPPPGTPLARARGQTRQQGQTSRRRSQATQEHHRSAPLDRPDPTANTAAPFAGTAA